MSKKFMFLLVAAVTLLLPIQVEADNLLSSHVDLTARKALTHDNGLRIIQNQPTVRINHATPPAGTAAQQDPGAGMKRDAIAKVKAQKPTGDATINEKQKNDALRMAHKPVARPSLRHGAVLRSDGEVRDADGVIIKPADGVRKVYNRSGRALFFDPDSDSWLETEQSGTSDVVICDDGTVYMRDIISTYRNGAWMKGTLSGNTISIPVGQLVNYESSFGVPYAVYWGQRDGRDYFKNDSRDVITYTIDGDVITLNNSDEENIIGIFYDYEGSTLFNCFGEYESVYTFDHDFQSLEVVTVAPPAGLQTQMWYTRGHYYEGSSVAFRGQVEVGIDGDDVYLHGLFGDYPDGWMHGTIHDGTVTFDGLQVQGQQDGNNIYAVGYNGNNLTSYVMSYDEDGGVFTSMNELLANGREDDVDFYTWIENITITRDDPFKPIEQYPYLNTFQTLDEQEAFTIVDANGDNDTWGFAYNSDYNWFARYTYNESMAADDWLISPAFHFEGGKQYRLTFESWNKGADERIEVMVGQEAEPGSMTIQVMEPTDIQWEEPQQVEAKIAIGQTGTYYIGFHAISDADMYRLFVDNVMVDVYELEAPAAPTGLTATQTEEQLEVTVNFTAPTVKRNGEPLTANLDKIELLRDGLVIHTFENVAPGTVLSVVDNGDDLTIGVHDYQVVPYNDKGAGDKSEVVTVKVVTTLNVPYTADLTQRDTFGVFTVIDANADGATWNWDDGYHTNYSYDSDNEADDYLVTLPVRLVAGKNYNVVVNAYNAGIAERFEVLLGTEPTVEGLNTTVIAPTEVTTDDALGDEFEGQFSVNQDGTYYLAVHAISDADMYRLMLNYLTIEFGAEPGAPAAPAISVEADVLAALRATVTVTAPTAAVDNSPLTGNVTRIDILRDGNVVGCVENVDPGASVTYIDEPDVVGEHTYQAIPYNEFGKGLKSEKVTAYVGPDIPKPVQNLTATDLQETVALNWDKVDAVGMNDGPVNPATVDYLVWSTFVSQGWNDYYIEKNEQLATVTDADHYDVAFNTDEGEQRMEYWIVETRNEANADYDGMSEAAGLLVGAPYELPLAEGFEDDALHYYWETNGTVMISPNSSDNDGSALALLSEREGETFFTSGKLDLNGLSNPTLVFDAASADIRSLQVIGSIDGGDVILLDNVDLSEAYTTFKVPLAPLQGGHYALIGFLADYGNASEIDHWEGTVVSLGDLLLMDNIHIADLYEHDLSVKVDAPSTVVAGNGATVTITVTNEGENVASGYAVSLIAGGKELLNVVPNQTLAPFMSQTYEAVFMTTVFDEPGDVSLVARVDYDADKKLDNNEAWANMTIVEPSLPAPTGLIAEKPGNDVLLAWMAPDVDVAVQATEDFEDTATFPEGSMGGITADEHNGALGDWTLYDGNGLLCYGFSGFEVPNLGAPMAWMPFNPASPIYPAEVADIYKPHSGNQLLLSTCVSEGDPIPSTDHWLISPELMGNEQVISFFARVITDAYGSEDFEVLYSTTGINVEDFISLSYEWIDNIDWVEFTYNLPEGARYFAIRHTSTDIFGLMLDDITFERGATTPVGYNVYVDGVLVGNTADTQFSIDWSGYDDGNSHELAVTAVYNGGKESSPAMVTFEPASAIVEILSSGNPVDVYTIDGRLVRRQVTSLEGLNGLYLIGNKKVLVK